jgi:predicted MPP superfamily phosphohydrolase
MGLQLGAFAFLIVARIGRWDVELPLPLSVGLFIWHLLILSVLVVGWFLTSSALGAAWLARRAAETIRSEARQPERATPVEGLSRRQFLGAAAAVVPPLIVVGTTPIAISQLQQFRTRHFTLRIDALPSALDGLTIAHVSDSHVGRLTRGQKLNEIVKATNDLDADLVLVTGDLINDRLSDLPAASDMLRSMKSRHGMFICEGNHDLIESRIGFEQGMRNARLPLLLNESAFVLINGQPVQVMGLIWGARGSSTEGRRSPEQAIARSTAELLPQRRDNAFPILLAHHPHAFDYAARDGIPLTLAGHTHGGQLHLSENIGFGPLMFRYWTGHYQLGQSHLIVSNGVGNWFPLRVGAPAELIHITLRRA